MRVYLGYDSREPQTYQTAVNSLLFWAPKTTVTPLNSQRLAECGLLRRPTDTRGQRYDIPSNAPASTEFAISRFLVPFLAQTGWALFADGDTVFMGHVGELMAYAKDEYAVMVVKHRPKESPATKMDGQTNLSYSRKNWSSVMLFNCDHPANRRLSLADVQERRGFDLHNFYWLHDSEIGELPDRCNWLVDVNPKPDRPLIAHFTLGTPELGVTSEHDHIWRQYAPSPIRAA